MPDHLIRIFLLFLAGSGSVLLSAQEIFVDPPDPELAPRAKLIVLSGISPELSDDFYRTFFLSAEHSFGPYYQAGLQYTHYLPYNNDDFYWMNTLKSSYEVAIFNKFFMHGRLTGRRSSFYYGPQLRFGLRRLQRTTYPNPPEDYQLRTTKFLFALGAQYRLGHAVLEWTLPIGLELARQNSDGPNVSESHLSMLPGIALGFRL